MRPPVNRNPLPPETTLETEQRRHGRLKAEILRCALGDVVDISGSGMRVNVRGLKGLRPGRKLHLRLKFDTINLRVRATVAWVRRTGMFQRLVGLEFQDVTPKLAEQLAELATTTSVRVDPVYQVSPES